MQVWLPIIGAGTDADPYRPDVPDGVPWSTRHGVPCELDRASPHYGKPLAVQYGGAVRIDVADDMYHRVAEKARPEHAVDARLVAVVHVLESLDTHAAMERIGARYGEDQQREALLQAARRGLPEREAIALAEEFRL